MPVKLSRFFNYLKNLARKILLGAFPLRIERDLTENWPENVIP